MRYTLFLLGVALAYKLGKEAAWEEIREAMSAQDNGHAVDEPLGANGK